MKKVLIGLVLIASGIVFAGDVVSPVVGNRQDRIIDESKAGVNVIASGNASLTVSSISASTVTATTVVATGIKIGTQTGFTGVVTNKMSNYTNLIWIGGGTVTNVTLVGAMP